MSMQFFFIILVNLSSNATPVCLRVFGGAQAQDPPTKYAYHKVTAYLYLFANFDIFLKKCDEYLFKDRNLCFDMNCRKKHGD